MYKYFIALCMMIFSMCAVSNPQDLVVNKMYAEPIKNIGQDALKVSLIIPCHYVHAEHLHELLNDLEAQTVLPDEVIISLSQYESVPSHIVKKLEEDLWMFPVTIMLSKRKLYAGQNRNVGSLEATGDIFIYQDADDKAHPQRIEIIKFLFYRYDLDHLMHRFKRTGQDIGMVFEHMRDVGYLYPSDYPSQVPGKDMTNGNIAISKRLFNAYAWPEGGPGEDESYNRMLYKLYERRLLVYNILFAYRYCLSTNREPFGILTKNRKKQYQIKIIYRT